MSVYVFKSSIAVPLKSGVQATADSQWKERRTTLPHKALRVVPGPLQNDQLKSFVVKPKALAERKCVPLQISYCCDIPESKEISAMQHDNAVNGLCVTCIVKEKDIISGAMADDR